MAVRLFPIVDGVALNCVVAGGTEGTPLVFINSLGTDLRIWDAVEALLAGRPGQARRPRVRYDKRGHGLSDCPPPPYALADHTADLVGLLDHLGHEGVILVGISVGGMIAMDCAARYPERVRALVLCDTAPRIGTAAGWNERIEALRAHGMDHLGRAILERWFAPGFARRQPAAYRVYYNMLTRTPVEGYTGTCEAIRDADLGDCPGRIRARALVLCGAEDVATPPEACRSLAASLVDARFEAISGAAHLPCIEQPDAFVAGLAGFLEDL